MLKPMATTTGLDLEDAINVVVSVTKEGPPDDAEKFIFNSVRIEGGASWGFNKNQRLQ